MSYNVVSKNGTLSRRGHGKLKVKSKAYHRNGVSGAPFGVVLFEESGEEGGTKVGIVFDEAGHCAILDVAKLSAGDIAFGSNSWRGDVYEVTLREILNEGEAA